MCVSLFWALAEFGPESTEVGGLVDDVGEAGGPVLRVVLLELHGAAVVADAVRSSRVVNGQESPA